MITTMEIGKVYFYTATILNWKTLLKSDHFKLVILDSLQYLSSRKKIKVYGYVIMPNHIHLIWELLEMNGKEFPHASFMKFTAHQFLKKIKEEPPDLLADFKVNSSEREYQFWQRNSLPKWIYNPKVLEQKLDYIHNNPVQGKWMLASDPISYPFSSARFYEFGKDDFGFLSHYKERF